MYCLIYTPCGSREEAEKIAETLVHEQLAACVNFFPIHSRYMWKGTLQKEEEYLLLIKTRSNLREKITKRIRQLHSYEVPAILVYEITDGNSAFFNWIDEQVVEY